MAVGTEPRSAHYTQRRRPGQILRTHRPQSQTHQHCPQKDTYMELFQKGPGNGLAGVIRGPPNLRSGGLEFLTRHRPAPRGKLGPNRRFKQDPTSLPQVTLGITASLLFSESFVASLWTAAGRGAVYQRRAPQGWHPATPSELLGQAGTSEGVKYKGYHCANRSLPRDWPVAE